MSASSFRLTMASQPIANEVSKRLDLSLMNARLPSLMHILEGVLEHEADEQTT